MIWITPLSNCTLQAGVSNIKSQRLESSKSYRNNNQNSKWKEGEPYSKTIYFKFPERKKGEGYTRYWTALSDGFCAGVPVGRRSLSPFMFLCAGACCQLTAGYIGHSGQTKCAELSDSLALQLVALQVKVRRLLLDSKLTRSTLW